MSTQGFTHLHLHSQYSLLDGAIRIKELIPAIKAKGMTSVAVTDHGNMYNVVTFYKKAKKNGIKPILGCEAYVAGERGRKDRTVRDSSHLILLAKNNEGYKNLKYLISMGFLEGFYYSPRLDTELLRKHAKGLYGLSACLGGVVTKRLLREGESAAAKAAREYQEIFEPGHFFLELQDNGYCEQARANNALIDIGKTYGIPLVATADSHYLRPEDSAAHEVLMCIQQNRSLREFRERYEHSDELYVKSPEQMWASFGNIAPEALENTVRIAEACNVELDLDSTYLPRYGVPEGYTLESYLEKISHDGLNRRVDEASYTVDDKAYRQRLDYELSVINGMGFAGYFLIVWDFIRYAKDEGIPVGPGRGSGAGSLVAWALRITDLDPIPNGLLFERFLNPERISWPDFDIDFCQDRRGEVIDYVAEKYGRQNVGQIVTYAEFSAKSGIKAVGRALELPFAEVNELTKVIPNLINGKKVSIDKALEIEPKLTQIQDERPVYRDVIKIARALEGLCPSTGMHAAGIVIGDQPLWEYVPVCRGKEGEIVTQFAKDEVEEAGLIKFDFLGLKTLTVVDKAVEHIRKRDDDGPLGPNAQFDIGRLSLDDSRVYALIASADTDGVFQLESSGFKEMLKRLRPDRFEDIVAGVALYRPGPLDAGMVEDYIARKHGKRTVVYPHPKCEAILEPTYGVIVYQEQVMQIAVDLCGFTMGQADTLRKAMGKKKADVMAKMGEKFVSGAVEHSGWNARDASALFEQIKKFAGYAFNKCVAGKTRIMNAETGEVTTVRELYECRRPFSVHAVDAHEKIAARPVTDVIYNGRKPVFELRTELGHRITATATHRLRTLDGWARLGDLRVGGRLAAPRHLRTTAGHEWPRHELVALAGILSRGASHEAETISIACPVEPLLDELATALAQFPSTVVRVEAGAGGTAVLVASNASESTATVSGPLALSARGTPGGLVTWARSLGLVANAEAHVPAMLFAARDEEIALFLGRLWAADGSFASSTPSAPRLEVSAAALARDVQTLLLRLGIISRVDQTTVTLVGRSSIEQFCQIIVPRCTGRDQEVARLLDRPPDDASDDTVPAEVRRWLRIERQYTGLSWPRLAAESGVPESELCGDDTVSLDRGAIESLARVFASHRLAQLADSDIYWDRIVAIEPRGVQETYDLTVDVDHNFIADGLVVHNSHSAAYAVISYQTAFLKTYYPVEFMAALMSTEMRNQDEVVKYIASSRQRGIEILPPSVNESDRDFSVVLSDDSKRRILFGLGAIKGLGDAAIDAIIEARNDGPFRSIYGFCERVDLKRVNRKVLEVLVKSGAFGAFGRPRSQLLAVMDRALETGQSAQKDRATGQTSLFATFARSAGSGEPDSTVPEVYPEGEDWLEKEKLAAEKEALGFYVSGHPLDRYVNDLPRLCSATTAQIAHAGDKPAARYTEVAVGGVITALRERPLKSGAGRMAFVTLEDLHGRCEVLVFSKVFAEYESILKGDEPVLIRGTPQIEGEDAAEVKLRATSVELLSIARAQKACRFEIAIPVYALDNDKLVKLKELLTANRGDVPARLTVTKPDVFETVIALPETLKVNPTDDLLVRVDQLFGQKVVRLC